MYPSWSSPWSRTCSSHKSSMSMMMSQSGGLTRYGSAPGSLLSTAVDGVVGAPQADLSLSPGSGDQSTCKANCSSSFGIGGTTCCSSSSEKLLLRQSSSPAGFLTPHPPNANANGFTITTGRGSYTCGSSSGDGVSRLESQLSFTGQDSLSQIRKIHGIATTSDNAHSYSFGIDPWDNSNSIAFSASQTKRSKNNERDILNCLNLNALESQFSLPQTTLEMATMEKLMNTPEDSVPCKIRAKRGCAIHPRSIAERERRTRISGKLKKLQDLVPNMDKQTSYADMLDLAVQHIKGLQSQIQKLNKELEHCSCGCKPSK